MHESDETYNMAKLHILHSKMRQPTCLTVGTSVYSMSDRIIVISVNIIQAQSVSPVSCKTEATTLWSSTDQKRMEGSQSPVSRYLTACSLGRRVIAAFWINLALQCAFITSKTRHWCRSLLSNCWCSKTGINLLFFTFVLFDTNLSCL